MLKLALGILAGALLCRSSHRPMPCSDDMEDLAQGLPTQLQDTFVARHLMRRSNEDGDDGFNLMGNYESYQIIDDIDDQDNYNLFSSPPSRPEIPMQFLSPPPRRAEYDSGGFDGYQRFASQQRRHVEFSSTFRSQSGPSAGGIEEDKEEEISQARASSLADTRGIEACGICLEDFRDTPDWPTKTLSCGSKHNFHRNCINQWLADHDVCPMCRGSVAADRPPPDQEPARRDAAMRGHNNRRNPRGDGVEPEIDPFIEGALYGMAASTIVSVAVALSLEYPTQVGSNPGWV